MKLTVYISTSDHNSFVIKYFQYFFNKYWGSHMNVKILGFNPPPFKLYDNFEFISMGSEQVGMRNGWSNYLIDYFSSIEDEFFIFGIDDFMIVREVDHELFEICKKLLDPTIIGRVDLQPSLQWGRDEDLITDYKTVDGIEFQKMLQSDPLPWERLMYQNAGAFSIWNRKWFLKNIRRDWSPFDWEVIGSRLAENDGFIVVGSKDRWVVRKTELLSDAAYPGILNTRLIREEDLEEMKRLIDPSDRVTKFQPQYGDHWYGGKLPDWENIIYGK